MIKTFAKTALTGAVLAALATGAFAAASGTYTGEAQGRNGPVKVEVTLADGKITAVKVVSHKEATGIADPAIERIPAAIAAEQSAAVDVVAARRSPATPSRRPFSPRSPPRASTPRPT